MPSGCAPKNANLCKHVFRRSRQTTTDVIENVVVNFYSVKKLSSFLSSSGRRDFHRSAYESPRAYNSL